MIKLKVNGEVRSWDGDPDLPLLWFLRDEAGLTGTKFGCGQALCGACTVMVDKQAVRSCITSVFESQGPIYDRSQEHLLSSDLAVVRLRKRLLDSAARVEQGLDPVGVGVDLNLIAAVDLEAPVHSHWRTLIPTHRIAVAA